jgi:MFS family permease
VTSTINDQEQSLQAAAESWPSAQRAWYALIVLMIVLVMAILDRQMITFLVDPIKSDLGISDIQVSLLMGFAFVAFYILVGLPVARLSDSRSRRAVIGVGITVWSLATAACGLARTGWQLAASRVGVGMGEACNGPASFSLLSDYFPPRKLPKALAVLSIGFYIGSAITNIVGSRVVAAAARWPELHVPIIGSIRSWQLCFIIVGLPGLAVAALMTTVAEPRRRGVIAGQVLSRKVSPIPIGDVFKFLLQQRSVYGSIFAGLALRFLVNFGSSFWLPTFFTRTYHWTMADSGFAIGAIQLTAAPLGLLAGGMLAEWYGTRGYADANMRVNLISTLLMVPAAALFPLMPSAWISLVIFGLYTFLSSLGPGPANAALQTITPNQMRAQVASIYLVIFNLVGGGLGPLLVAFLTDRVFGSGASLRYSLALTAAVLGPLACIIFAYGLAPYRQRIVNTRALDQQPPEASAG